MTRESQAASLSVSRPPAMAVPGDTLGGRQGRSVSLSDEVREIIVNYLLLVCYDYEGSQMVVVSSYASAEPLELW